MRSAAQHGRQAVGDDDAGAAAHQPLERLLDQPLALRIERAGRLVEQQQRRVAQDGPRDGDALALPAGQPDALLAQEGREASGRRSRNSQRRRGLGRGAHLVIAWPRAGRSGCCPRHRPRRSPAPAGRGRCGRGTPRVELAQVDAVEQDAAGCGIVEAQQQLEDAGLAGARRADQRHRLAGSRPRGRSRRAPARSGWDGIGEATRPRSDSAPCCAAGSGSGLAGARIAGSVSSSSNRRSAAPAARCRSPATSLEPADSAGHDRCEEDEGRELAGGEPAGQHVLAADPEHDDDGAEHQRYDDGGERRAGPRTRGGGGESLPRRRCAKRLGARAPPARRPGRCGPR